MADSAKKGLWAPTRGYFEIGEGSAAAPSEESSQAVPAASTAEPTKEAPAASAAAPDGAKVWAPTRGYFAIGGGTAAAKPGVEKAVPAPAAPEKPAASTSPTKTPAAPVTATKATAKKTATKKPAAKPKAPPAPEMDPRRDSITTVPPLAESTVGKNLGAQLYDEPDSETTLYRVPALNALFAVSSALLLLFTVLMVWQDYDRQWKNIQADWNERLTDTYEKALKVEQASQGQLLRELEPELVEIFNKLEADSAAEIQAEADRVGPAGSPARANFLLERARGILASDPKFSRYVELQEARDFAATAFDLKGKELRTFRGDFQAAKFLLDEEKKTLLEEYGDTGPGAKAVRRANEEFGKEHVEELDHLTDEVAVLEEKATLAANAYDEFVENETRIDVSSEGQTSLPVVAKDLETIGGQVERAEDLVATVEKDWRNFVRNMPFVDFLAPTYKIEKVVLANLHEDLNFGTVPRIDRCKTCHVNIDNIDPALQRDTLEESREWGSVFASHPRLDLFVGSMSPHPYGTFGCTTCHYGDGHATDFINSAHTPEDEEQEEEWKSKYDWHELHYQDYPMLKKKYTTSSCMKCHPHEQKLDGGGNFNLGYQVIKTYGCFGCHKIEKFKGFQKVGPNLSYIGGKVDRDFLYKWIRDPTHFRPTTRMPRFFDLSNSTGEMVVQDIQGETSTLDFDLKNGVEALALATYIAKTSDRRDDLFALPEDGDPVRGRQTFRTLGCLGCHSVRSESLASENGTGGEPDLAVRIQGAAMGLQGLAAGKSAARLEAAVKAAGSSLESLGTWEGTLSIDENVEGLYHRAVTALDAIVELDESLGVEGGPVDIARTAAGAVYDRWIHNSFAPDLSRIGSKVKSRAWLVDWIVDPRKHDPRTTMPQFRLDEDDDGKQMLADIVAYLMTLRDPEFDAEEVFSVEPEASARVLKEIAFNYKLTQVPIRADAQDAVDSMSVDDRLIFVGHNLIRRYGCFGCHDGIKDIGSKAEVEVDGEMQVVFGNFDRAQNIGADLDGWGVKLPARLDYAAWGHQPHGHSAIGHDRLSWAKAKLTDTRRFDVLPSEKQVAPGKHVYAVTNQLVQKTPEELLKMPLFGFAKNPDLVEAVVTFLAGLTMDPISVEMTHRLTGDEEKFEKGSRLIEELNCKGCHRIGAEPQFVNVQRLPRFSLFPTSDEEERRNELEKETWLNETITLQANPPKSGAKEPPGIQVERGTLLGQQVFDVTTTPYDEEAMEPLDALPVSVVELANGAVDSDSQIEGDFNVSGVREADRILPVAGFEEGRIRFYFGSGVDQRPLAPPPLVREGARVRSDWLFKWLQDVEPVRPWLKVRMPSFYLTQEDARTINDWFKLNAGVPTAHEGFEVDELDRGLAEKGKRLFGKSEGKQLGFSCNSCHPRGSILPSLPQLDPAVAFDYKQFETAIPDDSYYVVWRDAGEEFKLEKGFEDKVSAQTWAEENVPGLGYAVGDPWSKVKWGPDLTQAAGRLRPPWMGDWLRNPPDFMPGTAMPNFFGERHPLQGIKLNGPEDEARIRALLQYLVHMKSMGEGVAKNRGAGDD